MCFTIRRLFIGYVETEAHANKREMTTCIFTDGTRMIRN
ncbi:hypothetical protein Bsph_2949 [Lysinibacillus sphaericus C3-41]|uniref:Uncharacterized protein n=1 Tax=Lysinibacillus sphaericus (strain C3-41) TaxID=444177 RepID=B1HNG8_LYSSC|nr:hypothetical protein Bsph_2949 [Lysinibacillus sphaericus C3-41]